MKVFRSHSEHSVCEGGKKEATARWTTTNATAAAAHTKKIQKYTMKSFTCISVSISQSSISMCTPYLVYVCQVDGYVALRCVCAAGVVVFVAVEIGSVTYGYWMNAICVKSEIWNRNSNNNKKTLTTTTNSTQKRERREKKPTAKQKSRKNCGCVFWVDSCMELHDKMCNSLTKLNGKRQTAKYRASTHFCLYLVLYSSHFLPTSESRSLSLCTAS